MRTPSKPSGPSPRGAVPIPRAGWVRQGFLGLMTSLMLATPGLAWTAQFKQAPGAPEAAEAGDGMILGLIHQNTLFFVVLGVFAIFWFLFGGGRRAKVGRKGH